MSFINIGNTRESVDEIEKIYKKIDKISLSELNADKLEFVPKSYKSSNCNIYKYGKYYMFVFFKDDIVFTRYITYRK